MTEQRPKGFLTFTLNAHLPYVVNHGTWPHGIEWLHEAAAETYLPLLHVLENLERDHVPFNCNLNLSPTLLEQLAHPVFLAEFPNYLTRKIVAAREDEAFFLQCGEHHLAETARLWHRFFSQALDDFDRFGRDIIKAFRHFNDTGLIHVITTAATHSYMPLLGTDESVRAQVHTAIATHKHHFGKAPRGIWASECGYRPAGHWDYPVSPEGRPVPAGFYRLGIEQAFSDAGLEFFFVDTHLIERARRPPLSAANGSRHSTQSAEEKSHAPHPSFYQPHSLDAGPGRRPVTVFPRDPRTALQVWSSDIGYPGDPFYLDFHKKRWPGGHRYWRVTDSHTGMDGKQIYDPGAAAERIQSHAAHFVKLVCDTLTPGFDEEFPPVLNALFDGELFGHWWFEGPQWLEAVARILHQENSKVALISSAEYLDRFPHGDSVSLEEGSWGAGGSSQVWLNPETTWTWSHIYPAEFYLREVCTSDHWRKSSLAKRIVQQLCRELLLLESSDWQFLITTGAARDYAEIRFLTHNDQFNELKSTWQSFEANGSITAEQESRLSEIEHRDGLFPEIDPGLWSSSMTTETEATTQSGRNA